jgi:PilZ domain-containing protein
MSKKKRQYEGVDLAITEKEQWCPVTNKRRHNRVPLRVPVCIVSHLEAGDRSDTGTCTDISDGGVRIETEADLAVDDTVELVLYGKEQTVFCNYARIVYRSGSTYGACFVRFE